MVSELFRWSVCLNLSSKGWKLESNNIRGPVIKSASMVMVNLFACFLDEYCLLGGIGYLRSEMLVGEFELNLQSTVDLGETSSMPEFFTWKFSSPYQGIGYSSWNVFISTVL